MIRGTLFRVALVCACLAPTVASAGEALPPGPPWKTTWKTAKRAAVRTGRPIFAYFTKRH